MATEVYTPDEIKLQDGTEVTLVPLPIARLRKFMRVWGEFLEYLQTNADKPREERAKDSEVSDKQFDVFLELLVIALSVMKKGNPENNVTVKGDMADDKFLEYVGDTVDEQTTYRVFDKCAGLKLNDPKLEALTAALTADQDGTN